MNMFKRMASIVVMAVMVLQIAVFAAPVPEDVIGTEYEGAASLLCALEIMVGDGSNFNPDDNVTRAEFAQILMKTLKLDSATQAYTPAGLFTDVPTSEWYAAPVEIGAGIGAIKGYGDGTFGPDNNVLGTEAVKMMTYACGHDITAEANGGYPAGYMATAQQIGMLKGISSIDFSQPMTRGQAAVLCANTLKVDMKKKISEGDKIIYEQIKDVNLLSEKHDVYKAEGVLSANDVTSMWEASTLREGYVQIEYGSNSGIYKAGETTIADAIGQYIRAYYRYDEDLDENTIISYEALANRNEKTDVDLSDIDYYSVSSTKLEYWKDKDNDSRTTDIRFAETPSIIFNGASRTKNASITETFAQIKNDGLSGEVSFLDYDGDGKVDVLNIMAYDTVVVSKIDTKKYNIYKEDGTYKGDSNKDRTITIDIESNNVTAKIVDMDGDEVEFSDIAEGDILSIAKSDPGSREYAYVKICNDSIEGEITEIGRDEDKYVLKIDGEPYEVTDSYMHYVTGGLGINAPSNQIKIKIGTNGEFFLDSFGRIAYDKISGTSSDATFGFLKAYSVGKGTDDSLILRIYADGEYKDYSLAGKVEIDGVTERTTDAIKARLEASISQVADNYYTGEMMTAMLFELDSNGKIRMIDTPHKTADESDYTLQPVRGQTLSISESTWYTNTKTLGSLNGIASGAVMIGIPTKVEDLGTDSKLSMVNSGSWENERKVKLQMLTTDPKSYDIQYAIVLGGEAGRSLGVNTKLHDNQIIVVSSVAKVTKDGQTTIKIIGLQEGAQKEFTVDPDYYASDLYTDVWCFDATSDDSAKKYFSTYAGRVTESEERKSQILLPGDAIRVNRNDAGDVVFVTPTFLIDAKVFRADDQRPYRSIDLALMNRSEGSRAFFKYIIKKTGNSNASGTAILTVNEDGFVTGSEASSKEKYTFYENGAYLTGDTGMRDDEAYNPSQFKIMVYDANKAAGQRVYVGSESDLDDASFAETPASLVIMQTRSNAPRGMYIIKY